MSGPYIELSYFQVALAALLILINGAISVVLQLELERRLLLAAACTIVQLLLIGLVLEWVFRVDRWYVVLAMMTIMTVIAGVAAIQRTDVRYPGIWMRSVAATWASSWLVAAIALGAIVQVRPWYTPQYAIPLLGMILGNTLNGVSLGLDRLGGELSGKRDQVEAMLALGATRWEAARGPIRQAVRTGLIPTINAMMVVGIVSLPGMMTGQLLAGTSPVEAVKYQVVIMFLIASGHRAGHGLRRAAQLPPAVQRGSSVPRCAARSVDPAKAASGPRLERLLDRRQLRLDPPVILAGVERGLQVILGAGMELDQGPGFRLGHLDGRLHPREAGEALGPEDRVGPGALERLARPGGLQAGRERCQLARGLGARGP